MATIADLIPKQERDRTVLNSGQWFAQVVAPLPATLGTEVYVVIPDIDPHIKWGPCRWVGHALPGVGADALVIFDNRQHLWVMVWQ